MSFATIQDRFETIVAESLKRGASDIHIVAGEPIRLRVEGILEILKTDDAEVVLEHSDLVEWTHAFLNTNQQEQFSERGSVDGAFTAAEHVRLRFNLFRRSGAYAIALRRLDDQFRDLASLGLTNDLYRICDLKHGLILIAGPTGSGKSTTLATLLNRINETRSAHIITIEEPIEYVHRSQHSLVSQRQVGIDAPTFHQALVDSLRQDPDVILIGEIRDLETIRTAITAAETGHLVFASVHAGDCIGAIERLVSVFPADEQMMIQKLLSMVVRCVVAQHLVVADSGHSTNQSVDSEDDRGPEQHPGRVLVPEILWGTTAVSNLIASGQTRQIGSMMESGAGDGMVTLDASLANLLRQRKISEATARSLAKNPTMVLERSRRRP
ncbi:MAG: PilT/PilU family type 4a pilus ATPase [Pirellulaceae bacterium]